MVGVREVRGPAEAGIAEAIHERGDDGALLRVGRDEALPFEVLLRSEAESHRVIGEVAGEVLFEALEPVRHPAAARLKEEDPQPRMAFDHIGSQAGSSIVDPTGFGRSVTPASPIPPTARSASCSVSCTSSWGTTAGANRRRGSALQKSRAQSL